MPLLTWAIEFFASLDPLAPTLQWTGRPGVQPTWQATQDGFPACYLRNGSSTSLSEMHQPLYATWKTNTVLGSKFMKANHSFTLHNTLNTWMDSKKYAMNIC